MGSQLIGSESVTLVMYLLDDACRGADLNYLVNRNTAITNVVAPLSTAALVFRVFEAEQCA